MTSYTALIDSLRPVTSVVSLPVDDSLRNFPRRVVGAVFANVPVQSLLKPSRDVAVSVPALSQLLPGFKHSPEIPESFTQIFSGSKLPPKVPFLASHCYWGTQFGNYAGQLGDGTASLVGQSSTGYEINLKGTGQTPFSRGFDGRKVLRSSVREFLCSEAMAGLGIPTTRAAALVVSETSQVMRDVNYSGSPVMEKCAVVSRTAKSFFRFGSFESRDLADSPTVRKLAGYCWNELLKPNGSQDFITTVIDRTAQTVAMWQSVGFVHGVLNTDNMSILGDTIDYGPFGFVENFDPHFIPNTSDKFGRYAFSEQPKIAAWNLKKLYESLKLHIVGDSDAILSNEQRQDIYEKFGFRTIVSEDEIETQFMSKFTKYYRENMRKKLGLKGDVTEEEFQLLLGNLRSLFEDTAVDYTYTFRMLSELGSPRPTHDIVNEIMSTVPSTDRIGAFSSSVVRISKGDLPEIEEFAKTRMDELNRVGIDSSTIERWKFHLNRIENFGLCDNYQGMVNEFRKRWTQFVSEWEKLTNEESRKVMKRINPVYVPRQNLLQKAIEECENGNDEEVRLLLELLLNPYDVNPKVEHDKYAKPDLNFYGSRLSCSS